MLTERNSSAGIVNTIRCSFNKKQGFLSVLVAASIIFIAFMYAGKTEYGQYASYAKIRRYLSLQLGNTNELEESISEIFGDKLSFSVFIVIDSKYFTSSIERVVKKWSEEEPFMRYCNQSINCDVHMIFYKDDKRTNSSSLKESLIKIFKPQYNSSISKTKIHSIVNRPEDARYTNNEMMVTYIDGADYFLLITSEQIVYEGRTGRTMQELIDVVSNKDLRDIGTLLFTKPVPGALNLTATGCFFSKLHIEIFGEPFPYLYVPSIPIAFEFLVKCYPKNMKFSLSSGSKITSAIEANSTTGAIVTPYFKWECNDTISRYMKAVKSSGNCLRCGIKKNNKVIAMSLFGSDPRYTYGAIRNAQLLPVTFPGWRLWFYTEKEPKNGTKRVTPPVPKNVISIVEELGAEFRYIDPKVTGPRLWRFTVLEEMDIEYFAARDSDSRLTPRDAAVVAEWLKSGKPFHCARDHPNHSFNAINAGMWGGKPKELRKIFNGSLLTAMKKYGMAYVDDTVFLAKDFWPRLKENHTICHDSFSCHYYPSSYPFPVVRNGREHLGQVYDQHTIGRAAEMRTLRSGGTRGCIP